MRCVEVIFLESTYTQVMFMEMLLKSRIQRECEQKTPLLYMLYTNRLKHKYIR